MSTTATTADAPSSSSPLPAEMSDRFGPMLVKELRQGLRTKVFLSAFIGFQVILLIMVLAGFAAQGVGESSAEFINGAIWTVLVIMMVLVTPMRGQAALDKEMRMGTLELLQITDLNAWRIVRGKWGALMGEAMLYLASALPYFTLRYFLGGVNILADLGLLALLALFSASLTAIIVGLSGFRSILLRIGIAVGVCFLVPYCIVIIIEVGPRFFSSTSGWLGVAAGFVLGLIVVGWSFLRLGARTIATQAENHSTLPRLLVFFGLVAMVALDHLTGAGLGRGMGGSEVFFMFALILYTCGLFAAITDSSLQSSRIYSPFIRRHLAPLGRLLLYPGWGSGFFYVLALSIPILFTTLMAQSTEITLILVLAFFNFLMLPAAIARTLMRSRHERHFNLSTYITMMVVCALGSVVLMIAESVVTDGEPAITMLFSIPAIIGGGFSDESMAIALQFLSAFIVAAVLFVYAIEDLQFTRRREEAASRLLAMRAAKPDLEEPQS